MNHDRTNLELKVTMYLTRIGVDPAILTKRKLQLFEDAECLVVADVSESGREHQLIPEAAEAWRFMKSSAKKENISLIIVSAFRSFSRQTEIVNAKIRSGEKSSNIFQVLAPPGCSQHHSGRALDIGTYGCEPASESFEQTDAFQWLQVNAQDFGYYMTYGKDNSQGFQYEPWHWCYKAKVA